MAEGAALTLKAKREATRTETVGNCMFAVLVIFEIELS